MNESVYSCVLYYIDYLQVYESYVLSLLQYS